MNNEKIILVDELTRRRVDELVVVGDEALNKKILLFMVERGLVF